MTCYANKRLKSKRDFEMYQMFGCPYCENNLYCPPPDNIKDEKDKC